MPNVLVEAFSAGLPVIASDIAENRHVVGDSAALYWVNPYDVDDIANAIDRFICDQSSDAIDRVLVAKGIAEQYSLDRMVENYQLFYRNMQAK